MEDLENIIEKEEKFEGEATKINIVFDDVKQLKRLSRSKEFISFSKNKALEYIEYALDKGLENITIFDISNLSLNIEIKKENFPLILESILEYYVEKEDYEKCSEIRNLIQKSNEQ